MIPRKDDEVLVDVLDVILRDGIVLRADVIVSVADIPLIGIKLTAAIAGMETMNEYGLFEAWDVERRRSAVTRRQHKRDRRKPPDDLDRITVGSRGERTQNEEESEEDDEANAGGSNSRTRDDGRR